MDRYRAFAQRLATVLGLGAPLAGCWTNPGPSGVGNGVPQGAASTENGSPPANPVQATPAQAARKPSDVASGKFGPFPSEEHYSEHVVTCVPSPDPARLCPPDAILANGHGKTTAPFRREGDDGTCCYGPAAPGFHWRGRALRGPGGVALAAVEARQDWASPAAAFDADALPAAARAELAEVWLRDAAFEHASVAAFARLSLELVALGAPAELVADAHRAALDEIAHAEQAFAIASRLAGHAVGPAALAVPAAAPSFEALARDCVRDGCYGESVAVMLAHAARDATGDDALRDAYARIAVDEQRHAELAFRIVAWAIARDAEARRAVEDERAALAATLAAEPVLDPAAPCEDADAMVRLGVLTPRTEALIRDRTVRTVVLPCLDALLAA